MSQVLAIYAALAAKTVTVNATVVSAYDLPALRNSIETANLPCRMMLPFQKNAEGRQGNFIAMGTGQGKITWRVTDLMLWAAEAAGTGMVDYAATLVAYAGAYAEMLRTIRAPVSAARITNFTCAPDIYEWPPQSGRFYYGCEAVIDVEEILFG